MVGWFYPLYNSQGGSKFTEGYPCQGWWLSAISMQCGGFNSSTSQTYIWYCQSPVGGYNQVPNDQGYPSYEVGVGCYTNGGASGGPWFEYWNGNWYISSVLSTLSNCVLQSGASDPNECDASGGRWYSYNEWGPYFDDVWTDYLWDLNRVA